MADIIVSYETIFDILRREKQREELQELPATFISDVNSYLHDKEDLLKHPFSKEHDHVRTQIANTKKILKELVERRENKIIRLAQDKARGSTIHAGTLLPQEQGFFAEASAIIGRQRRQLFDDLFTETRPERHAIKPANPTAMTTSFDLSTPSTAAPDPTTIPQALPATQQPPLKTVRILQPLPKFAGKDLEVYGPYKREDTPSLPLQIADILIKKGRAEEA